MMACNVKTCSCRGFQRIDPASGYQAVTRESSVCLCSHALMEHCPGVTFIEAFRLWAPSCAQLLDGWHADGTAWSEWDETVRAELSRLMQQIEVTR